MGAKPQRNYETPPPQTIHGGCATMFISLPSLPRHSTAPGVAPLCPEVAGRAAMEDLLQAETRPATGQPYDISYRILYRITSRCSGPPLLGGHFFIFIICFVCFCMHFFVFFFFQTY